MDMLHFRESDRNRDVISLFSGAMGLDLGLIKSGLNIVMGQDFDASCVNKLGKACQIQFWGLNLRWGGLRHASLDIRP